MPSKDVAKDFRRLADYMRQNRKIYESFGTVDDIKKATRRSNKAKLSARDIKRAGTIDALPIHEKAMLIALGTFYLGTTNGMNKFLKVKTNLNRTKDDSELPKDKQGQRGISSITVTFDESKTMLMSRFPFKIKYRDPDRAAPYNFHWGAARKFKRYGVTEVNVFGQRLAAGRKGTRLQGLGYEPMGTHPKVSANFSKDYRLFRRIGYPGRRKPDQITIKDDPGLPLKLPVYNMYFFGVNSSSRFRSEILREMGKVTGDFLSKSGSILVVTLSDVAKEI